MMHVVMRIWNCKYAGILLVDSSNCYVNVHFLHEYSLSYTIIESTMINHYRNHPIFNHGLIIDWRCIPFTPSLGGILIPKPKFYFHGPTAFQCLNFWAPIKLFSALPSNTTLKRALTQQPLHPFIMDTYNNTFILQKSCNTFHKPPHKWQVDIGASILWSHKHKADHNQLLIRKTG